jgi:hypothetical protein
MSLQLTSGRMATFSDGVIAVIITVMVLDLNRSLPNTYASWRRSDKAGNFLGSLCRSHSAFVPLAYSRDDDACRCRGFMAYSIKTGFGNDARQKQGSVSLTATAFRDLIIYRGIPIAIFLSWVRVTRRSAHQVIQLKNRSDLEKGWRRSFFDIHIWNIPKGLRESLVTNRGTHDHYATIDEN